MPKTIKKRISKKPRIDESEVKNIAAQTWSRISDLISDRKKEVILAASAVAVIIVISIVFLIYNSSKTKKARAFELDANNIYYSSQSPELPGLSEKEMLGVALDLFLSSINIRMTPIALYSLGNTYFRLGDYASSINEYKRFIDNFSDEDEILPLVYQRLASAYFRSGNNSEAIVSLQKFAGLNNGIFKDTALVLEARHYAAEGNEEMALARYEELVSNFPASLWSAEAAAKIAPVEEETTKGVLSLEPGPEVPVEIPEAGQ
jgi:tetratricopeptide (TPR) repeat protein